MNLKFAERNFSSCMQKRTKLSCNCYFLEVHSTDDGRSKLILRLRVTTSNGWENSLFVCFLIIPTNKLNEVEYFCAFAFIELNLNRSEIDSADNLMSTFTGVFLWLPGNNLCWCEMMIERQCWWSTDVPRHSVILMSACLIIMPRWALLARAEDWKLLKLDKTWNFNKTLKVMESKCVARLPRVRILNFIEE